MVVYFAAVCAQRAPNAGGMARPGNGAEVWVVTMAPRTAGNVLSKILLNFDAVRDVKVVRHGRLDVDEVGHESHVLCRDRVLITLSFAEIQRLAALCLAFALLTVLDRALGP